MKKYLKRTFVSAGIELFVGIVAILISIFAKERLSLEALNYLRSFANALFVVCIALVIRGIRLSRNKELLEKMEVASADERNISIRNQSAASTLQVSMVAEALGGFILALLGHEAIGSTLCVMYGIQTIIYFAFYLVNEKKN